MLRTRVIAIGITTTAFLVSLRCVSGGGKADMAE